MAQQNNEPRHYLSGDGVLKEAWNAQTSTLEVALKNTEISIELSAADGDSVRAVRHSETLAAGEHACAGMVRICRYGSATIEVSPDMDGDSWHPLDTTELVPKEICAMRIKISGSGKVVICG